MGAANILMLGVLGAVISLWGVWPLWGRPKLAEEPMRRRPMNGGEKARLAIGIVTFLATAAFTVVIVGFVVAVSSTGKWGG